MGIIELISISVSLAMDAFSASICKGLKEKKFNLRNSLIVGLYFGFFQSLMPTIGYYLGNFLSDKISAFDHYLAFILLSFIGFTMIKESNKDKDDNQSLEFKEMLLLSIATSIDALIVGITFSFLKVNLLFSVLIIGIITFLLTSLGYNIGNFFGLKYQKKAQILGGIILIIMGLKILIEHLLWNINSTLCIINFIINIICN